VQVPLHQEDKISRDDRSALICCHEPSYLEYLTGQLRGIGYKVHHAATQQVALGKLVARAYQVTVLVENLEGCDLAGNLVLRHLSASAMDERRQTYVVMLCQAFATGDELNAYAWSVDQVINYQDIAEFAHLIVPALEEHHERNRHFTAALADR
jgi:CheY-like chemotaxis protein